MIMGMAGMPGTTNPNAHTSIQLLYRLETSKQGETGLKLEASMGEKNLQIKKVNRKARFIPWGGRLIGLLIHISPPPPHIPTDPLSVVETGQVQLNRHRSNF